MGARGLQLAHRIREPYQEAPNPSSRLPSNARPPDMDALKARRPAMRYPIVPSNVLLWTFHAAVAFALVLPTPHAQARQDFDLDLNLDLDLAPDSDVVIDIDSTVKAAEAWARTHLDERVADAIAGLADPTPERTRKAMDELAREFAGDSIPDLARVRKIADLVLPLLEESEETADLAPWLRTRLDYFDVADELVAEPLEPPPTFIPPSGTNSPSATNSTGSVSVTPQPSTNPPPIRIPSTNALPTTNRSTARATSGVHPSAPRQRTVWQKIFAKRPAPVGAEAFANRLKPIFTETGVPAELVWLAEVESSFNPEATSPAGAVGLFQLMPATARSLGLSTSLPDERRQPAKAAKAAATYLGKLHARFGDWRLALAAYNAGEGRIQRTLDRLKARTFDEIAPSLPVETQMYVPKYEAVLRRREGKSIDQLTP